MKPIRFILLIMLLAVAISAAFAQAPQRVNYQAVARDASGNPISEKNLAVRISIVDGSAGGPALYTETFSATTSKQGLFSIQVGNGTATSGTFSSLNWTAGSKFLRVEIDPAGGSAFAMLGTSQLLSVPYAFAADKLSSPLSISELSDVADTAPGADQVLKWDGSAWTPATVAGTGALVTSAALSGDGSTEEPLTIASQNATSGQVLQWSGTDWRPATINGGVGDNWGTQSVVVNSTLSGAGTLASPLGISTLTANLGDVLKYNGNKWAPVADGGDNWGTAKVNTSTQFEGDGTPVNPLKLAQQAAEVGQFLKWSGTGWIPGDGSGSLTLPASGVITDPEPAFEIRNNTGIAISGVLGGNSTSDIYAIKGRVISSGQPNTAGVMGHHNSTSAFGYGVLGLHDGEGSGVYGQANGATGYGVTGRSNGANGAGIYGLSIGATGRGVSGNAGGANGIGVYGGSATTTGYGVWSDGQMMTRSNSTSTLPNLTIWEDDVNDKGRVRFTNGLANRFWDVYSRTTSSPSPDLDRFVVSHFSGGDIITATGDKRVGINTSTPETDLDVNGSLRVANGIKLQGTFGTSGQVITNTSSGPKWGNGTITLYNNTILGDQIGDLNAIAVGVSALTELPNLTSIPTFTLTGTEKAKVIFTFSHSQLVSNGTGDVNLEIEIGFMQGAAIVNRAIVKDVILNNRTKSISYTHHCMFTNPGTYTPYIYVGTANGAQFNAIGTGSSTGQVSIQVIRE